MTGHVKSAHTHERNYACDFVGCGKSFLTGTRLRRHQAVHEGSNKYRCTDYAPCNEVFRKHSTLHQHILSVHRKQKPFPCGYTDASGTNPCPDAFDTAAQLRRHQGRHHSGERFRCSDCCAAAEAAAVAAVSGHGNNGGSYGRPPNSQGQCELNEQQIDPSAAFAFSSYALLQAHLQAAHPPTCTVCSLTCTTERQLRHHLKTHHPDADDPSDAERESSKAVPTIHICDIEGCEREFTRAHNLKVHKRTVHEGEKRFICSAETDLSNSKKVVGWTGEGACHRAFQTKSNLEEHIRTQHLGLPGTARPGKPTAATTKRKTSGSDGHGKGKRKGTAPAQASAIASLTGVGYYDCPETSGRYLVCPFAPTCGHRFTRPYGLEMHLSKHHQLDDNDHNLKEEVDVAVSAAQGGGNDAAVMEEAYVNPSQERVGTGPELPFWIGGYDGDGLENHPYGFHAWADGDEEEEEEAEEEAWLGIDGTGEGGHGYGLAGTVLQEAQHPYGKQTGPGS